ncbi:testisin-like isoform X2 [Ornithodoros turicata]
MNALTLLLTLCMHLSALVKGYTINITINTVDPTPRFIESYPPALQRRPVYYYSQSRPPTRHKRPYSPKYYYYQRPPPEPRPRPQQSLRPAYGPPYQIEPGPALRPIPSATAPFSGLADNTYDGASNSGGHSIVQLFRRPPSKPGRASIGSDACVGGARCTFFLQCWMVGGSLGSSCGPLLTCCITPSDSIIKPRYYGPVKNDPYCGRSGGRISRIVGGNEAEFGQFPWQAFIQVAGSRCGGTLVSRQHVVTAGHCVAKYQYTPSSIRVTLGDYVLNSDVESIPSETFGVRQIRIHPNFRFTPQADRYDVAVLVLDRPVVYKPNIMPICLPPKDADFVSRIAVAAGWGALEPGSKVRPRVLQHVHVPVLPNQVCETWHRRQGINIRIHDEMLCAGYERGGKDSCQGDSGGPLMLNHYGVYYLIGIVSAGYSCAKNYQPGIYHRVSSSSDWISSSLH